MNNLINGFCKLTLASNRYFINNSYSNTNKIIKPLSCFYSTNIPKQSNQKIKTFSTKQKDKKPIQQKNNNNDDNHDDDDDENEGFISNSFQSFSKDKIIENEQDEIKGHKERLNKVLSRSGVASRRKADEMIREGRVKVNGVVTTLENDHFVSIIDEVEVDGKIIKKPMPRMWMHFKKPKVLVTHSEVEGRESLVPILKKVLKKDHLITVGRLDYYSEGLILLTNDGNLSRYLEHPDNEFERTYRVRIFGKITQEMQDIFTKGIVIDNIKYKPIEVIVDKESKNNSWVVIKIKEGKNREIRKILEYFNIKVLRLIRVGYGPYELPESLKHGETIEIPLKSKIKKFLAAYNKGEKTKRYLLYEKKKLDTATNKNENTNN
ncbi:hypothetical protein DICPUDRAFT_147740 [Dictyostelium purpureum]|uniref:RNA-binding S4 domain-containing protein n=1 Tax=Dictyostelium purpureum TaxID=5786 RepID=F0Z999_DICPU|nr:uncharacterized protein DICPUDRAFT_147740 [Dictyostelium purpureum]EGC39465.1 hypothetical protein DICPUDRAFT_147740 [Dictyostelium purpureum]|eukprot:XP_003284023.1 hypothetical protein DICPUDRAFT_147740 [Dictyostelium purpureum]